MSDTPFDLLLSLPSVLECVILSDWLDVSHIVRLDSAYCVRTLRPRFHGLYEQPELVCRFEYSFRNTIRWFLSRRIKASYFDVCVEISTELTSNYLRDCGRFIRSFDYPKVQVILGSEKSQCTVLWLQNWKFTK